MIWEYSIPCLGNNQYDPTTRIAPILCAVPHQCLPCLLPACRLVDPIRRTSAFSGSRLSELIRQPLSHRLGPAESRRTRFHLGGQWATKHSLACMTSPCRRLGQPLDETFVLSHNRGSEPPFLASPRAFLETARHSEAQFHEASRSGQHARRI